MRFFITGNIADIEVIGEPFEIDGSTEKFAVHQSVGNGDEKWTASHVETGFRVGGGETIDDAIVNATERWLSATPKKREEAIKKAHALNQLPPEKRGM